VYVSGDGKSLWLKNALLPHDDRHTQAKADDVTRPCALGSRRVGVSNKSCRARARDFYAHMDICLHGLTASHTALAVRVTARARREPRGCQCFLGVDLKGKNIFDPSAEFSIYCTI